VALFTRDSIDRLRDAIDMVQLVSAKTDLRRVGSRWTGLCPFHDERTPSFSVNAEEKLFYCFGCQAKGDAFDFVEQSEGLDFRESLEFLAERFGVDLELENEDPQAEDRRRRQERLLKLLDRTAGFYAKFLWDSVEAAPAREYLAERGLGEEVLREFRVGWSPVAGNRVVAGAGRDGFGIADLTAVGLAQRGRDRFHGRIMFPLVNWRGKVLGFGARAMAGSDGPKYLNTSENDIYRKGRQLFGIDRAREQAAKRGRIVVVEGYTDVLALHQAGIRESVAIMGTALTAEQMAELGRAAPVVVLALDADRSGQEAMLRAAQHGSVELRAVEMPEGTDPADLLASEGAEAFGKRLDGAIPMLQFQVRRLLADADLDTPAGRDKALLEARGLIDAAQPAMRQQLIREVADRLDVPTSSIELALQSGAGPAAAVRSGSDSAARFARTPGEREPTLPAGASAGEVAFRAEREFLTRCLASGDLGREYLGQPSDEQLSSDATRRARAHLVEHFDDPLADLSVDEPALAALVTDVALAAQEQPPSAETVLRMSILQLEKRRLEREIRRAAGEGDHARQSELAAAEQRVRGELDEVMGQTA
jgi:DNA primase